MYINFANYMSIFSTLRLSLCCNIIFKDTYILINAKITLYQLILLINY